MSGTTMSVSHRYAQPDDVGGLDPVIAAVARGLAEIRRLVEHLQLGLTDAR